MLSRVLDNDKSHDTYSFLWFAWVEICVLLLLFLLLFCERVFQVVIKPLSLLSKKKQKCGGSAWLSLLADSLQTAALA